MSTENKSTRGLLAAGLVVVWAGCGAPELPPAGPAPGEVDVGYGPRRAGATTGAVSSMDEEQSSQPGVRSVEDLLRGRVAGLEVISLGRVTQYRLRGQNSIQNQQEPLFIVDGIPTTSRQLPSALSGVIAEDIRQISVLKDVASTSIYGMRGAGGVIIITTRR